MGNDFPHKQKIINAIIEAEPAIRKIFLFGSRVGAQNINPHADIDIGIVCGEKLGLVQLARIDGALDRLDMLFKVDVVDFTDRQDDFSEEVMLATEILYEKR